MSMIDWAENEVKLACQKEAPDRKDGEWDYGCACYESALKAFKSLCEDGHSGFSFAMTRSILNRLMDNAPLTPIEDTPDIWNVSYKGKDGEISYQCKRLSRLFKDVYPDGKVVYADVDRYYCFSSSNPYITFTGGIVGQKINEWFPIEMPYYPPIDKYKFCVDEFLTDRNNGDFDTVYVKYVIKPDGEEQYLNKAFAEKENGFVEIDRAELAERIKAHQERELREKR